MTLKDRIAKVLRERIENDLLFASIDDFGCNTNEVMREMAAAVIKEFQAFVREADVEDR